MAVLDIVSWAAPPAGKLSNFAPHAFIFDEVECAGMEGLLHAFKFDDVVRQRRLCKLSGLEAKNAARGRAVVWQKAQTLWWNCVAYPRLSPAYQGLLDRAFDALATNPDFRQALLDTNDAFLTHSIGGRDPTLTILTEAEFCTRLMRLRREIREGLR